MKGYIISALLALLLVAACSQGGGQLTDETEKPVVQTRGSIEVSTGDGSATKPANDAKSEIEAIAAKAGTLEFMATYDLSSDFAEGISGELSLYMKGGKMRTDTKTLAEGKLTEVRNYMLSETEFVVCSNQESMWQCFKFTAPQQEQQTPLEQPDIDEAPEVLRMADRIIAGTTAACYSASFVNPPSSWEACYSKEGVPLYMRIKSAEGSITHQAKSYKTSVPSDAFTPPATPQSFEEMMTQYGAQ